MPLKEQSNKNWLMSGMYYPRPVIFTFENSPSLKILLTCRHIKNETLNLNNAANVKQNLKKFLVQDQGAQMWLVDYLVTLLFKEKRGLKRKSER
jgi:hypothetical protein